MKPNMSNRAALVRPADVHDVLVPLWLAKEDAAKDAVGRVLRAVLGDAKWMEGGGVAYFEAKGKVADLQRQQHRLEIVVE